MPQKLKQTLVFAGNYAEFLDWCRMNQRTPRDPTIVHAETKLRVMPHRDFEIVKVGTWYENDEVVEALKRAEFIQGCHCRMA